MSANKKRISLTVVVLLAFISLITGVFVSQHLGTKKKVDLSQLHGTLLEQPRQVSQFELTGIDNKAFNNSALQGQWTMVFFGFTNCGSICPTTMAQLAKTYRLLEEKGVSPLPQIVMVSIDPDRDSLEKLGSYVKAYNPNFYAARGDEDRVKKMTKELGIAYARVNLPTATEPGNYDVQHSGAVMLFNPQGELSAFFTSAQPDLLAQDYQLLVS